MDLAESKRLQAAMSDTATDAHDYTSERIKNSHGWLIAKVEELAELVKEMVTSAVNVQQGARDMVKFSDDRALEYKHEVDRQNVLIFDLRQQVEFWSKDEPAAEAEAVRP